MNGVFNIPRKRLFFIYLPNLLTVLLFDATDFGISPNAFNLILLYAGLLAFSFAFCLIAYGFVNVLTRVPV
jgi:hypothetical protein